MFALFLVLAAAPPPVDCSTLRKAVDKAPTASAPRILLSVCLERAGAKSDAIAITQSAVPLAMVEDVWPNHGGTHLPTTLKRLAALGVDIGIPRLGTCGQLEAAPGCSKAPLFACSRAVAKEGADLQYGRVDVTISPYFSLAQQPDDRGDSPTFGLPVHIRVPGTCSLMGATYDLMAPEGQATTLPLQSKIEGAARDGGRSVLLDANCQLVVADACHELVAAVCKLDFKSGEAKVVILDHHLTPERSESQKTEPAPDSGR